MHQSRDSGRRFLSAKKAVASTACHPWIGTLLSAALNDRIPHRGCMIDTSSRAVQAATKASLFWGFYESAETRFVKRHLRPDLDVIELGSSLGVIASHIAKILKPDCKLVCVEANPDLLEPLQRNVSANAPEANMTVVHAAVSYDDDRRTAVAFHRTADNTASALKQSDTGETIEVPTVTLEALIRRFRITNYTLVCDIEGAEAGLIEKEHRALTKCSQLIIELHASNWQTQSFSVADLSNKLQVDHQFTLRDVCGPVGVFERSA